MTMTLSDPTSEALLSLRDVDRAVQELEFHGLVSSADPAIQPSSIRPRQAKASARAKGPSAASSAPGSRAANSVTPNTDCEAPISQ